MFNQRFRHQSSGSVPVERCLKVVGSSGLEVAAQAGGILGSGVRVDQFHCVQYGRGVLDERRGRLSLLPIRDLEQPSSGGCVWKFASFFVLVIFIFVFCYARILIVIRRQARVMAGRCGPVSSTAQTQSHHLQSNVITRVLVSVFTSSRGRPTTSTI